MRPLPAALCALALATGGAPARSEPAQPSADGGWIRAPNTGDMVWPGYAYYTHLSGRAVLDCAIDEKGKLRPCIAVEETPPGRGFAAAAMSFLQPTKMRPPMVDGAPAADARVRISVDFDGRQYGVRFAWEVRYDPSGASRPSETTAAATPAGAPQGPAPRLPGHDVTFAEFHLFTHFSAGPYYPEEAMRRQVTGSARLNCTVAPDGALKDCAVIAEAPQGMGFGKAAELMARRRAIRLKPAADAPAPHAGERIDVSVPFTIAPGG